MARIIAEIQSTIKQNLDTRLPGLNTSKVGEWSLWQHIVAVAIHSFELILDLFKKEIDDLTDKITPGTLRWYAEMCKRFHNGENLLFDEKTALLYYKNQDDKTNEIIKVAAVSEVTVINDGVSENKLFIKVAKEEDGKITELSADEKYNFVNYIEAIKFAGCQTEVISTKADQIQYQMRVYHDPAIAHDKIESGVLAAIEAYKTSLGFDGVLYRQQLIDAVMGVEGVTTVDMYTLRHHRFKDPAGVWQDIDTHASLDAGYFDYSDTKDYKCLLEVKSINELLKA